MPKLKPEKLFDVVFVCGGIDTGIDADTNDAADATEFIGVTMVVAGLPSTRSIRLLALPL